MKNLNIYTISKEIILINIYLYIMLSKEFCIYFIYLYFIIFLLILI